MLAGRCAWLTMLIAMPGLNAAFAHETVNVASMANSRGTLADVGSAQACTRESHCPLACSQKPCHKWRHV